MSFRQLYDALQQLQLNSAPRVSTRWLYKKAIEFSEITHIVEMWSGVMDDVSLRGFYIEGPLGSPVPLKDNQSLIALGRKVGSDKAWRRLVFTKELMHVFDTADEKTDSPEKLDELINRFSNPKAGDSSQFRAEAKAIWRAFAVLCKEEDRKELKRKLVSGIVSLEVVSATLRLPASHLHFMFGDDFEARIAQVMDE